MIRADAYTDTKLVVDDRLSNLQKYRVAIVGKTSNDNIFMQVITLDLVKSLVDDGRANLSDLKQDCVSQIKLNEELIVIHCDQDHSLSIIQIKENSALQLIYRITLKEENTGQLTYSDLVVIRHSKRAFMIFL